MLQRFNSTDHRDHNPWFMTPMPKTLSNAPTELFTTCAKTFFVFCIKCSLIFLISQLIEEWWRNESHITFWIHCLMNKHEPKFASHTDCTSNPDSKLCYGISCTALWVLMPQYLLSRLLHKMNLASSSEKNVSSESRSISDTYFWNHLQYRILAFQAKGYAKMYKDAS